MKISTASTSTSPSTSNHSSPTTPTNHSFSLVSQIIDHHQQEDEPYVLPLETLMTTPTSPDLCLPPPTHFISSASRRLPELQQHLHLNPETITLPDLPDQDSSETDLLLPQSTYHHPSFGAPQSPCPHIDQHHPNPHEHGQPCQPLTPSGFRHNAPVHKLQRKMGTFDGVYLPTILSIFNVLYFLRFGYCIGQIGLFATLLLLLLAYVINILTVFSLSAIATNGQVRGGGAYCESSDALDFHRLILTPFIFCFPLILDLISRTLGPEFGGSIGILFCLSQAMTASMNIIGFIESLIAIAQLRIQHPVSNPIAPSDPSPPYTLCFLLQSAALFGATLACIGLGRTKIFSSMARSMATILLITLLTIFLSFVKRPAFSDPSRDLVYTSFSIESLLQNLYPSRLNLLEDGQRALVAPRFSDYQKVFGIIFPSVSGILAGSSLSGELRKPSKSLPQGMLWALFCVMVVYVISLVGLSLTCERESFELLSHEGFSKLVVYQISQYPTMITLGLLLSTIFSSIMGITVCGKILQAISRDGA